MGEPRIRHKVGRRGFEAPTAALTRYNCVVTDLRTCARAAFAISWIARPWMPHTGWVHLAQMQTQLGTHYLNHEAWPWHEVSGCAQTLQRGAKADARSIALLEARQYLR